MATPAIEIAPRVYRIPTLGDFINSYALVDDDEQVTLIDCGLKRAPARIVRGLTHIGKHPRDVTRIVLTHAHNDHAGGARNLVASTAVDGVAAHHDDAPSRSIDQRDDVIIDPGQRHCLESVCDSVEFGLDLPVTHADSTVSNRIVWRRVLDLDAGVATGSD